MFTLLTKLASKATAYPRLCTALVAISGTIVFVWAQLPLPFLFGPMTACLLAALLGAKLGSFGAVTPAARTILGVAIGASITPALLLQLPSIALSAALVPVFLVLITVVGVPCFRYLCRFDPVTAYYAAMPGGLQDMVLFGSDAGGNARVLSLVHATRVLIIVTLVPLILAWGYGVNLNNPIGLAITQVPVAELLLMVGAAALGWKGAHKIGMMGAAILGPLLLTAVLSLSGLINTRPPKEAILAAQFFIGTGIGSLYVGITLNELQRVVGASIVYLLVLAMLAALFTYIVNAIGVAPSIDAFLAFAPGGQAEMTVLAIIADADLSFVIAHHIIRIVLVISLAPVLLRLFR